MLLKIINVREDSDLTQKELAKMLGVSTAAICNWENGNIIIPIRKLNKLANYFDVSFDYLLGLSRVKDDFKFQYEELNKILVGQRIKEMRIQKQVTLRELAKALNTTSSTISAYETGKTLLLTAFAYDMAVKYDISVDWLYGKK